MASSLEYFLESPHHISLLRAGTPQSHRHGAGLGLRGSAEIDRSSRQISSFFRGEEPIRLIVYSHLQTSIESAEILCRRFEDSSQVADALLATDRWERVGDAALESLTQRMFAQAYRHSAEQLIVLAEGDGPSILARFLLKREKKTDFLHKVSRASRDANPAHGLYLNLKTGTVREIEAE